MTDAQQQLQTCPTCGSEGITFDPGPQLWCHEEDTYTQQGDGLVETVFETLLKIVGPYMAAGADSLHVDSLVAQGARMACQSGWDERNGNNVHP